MLIAASSKKSTVDIDLFRSGDHETFNTIFNDYEAKLIFYINQRVRNLYVAKEIALEAFAVLWEKKEMVNDLGHVGAYLFTTARNASYDYSKEKGPDDIDDQMTGNKADDLSEGDIIEFTMMKVEIIKRLYEGMETGQYKKILGLSMEGRSAGQIAKELGISIQTVKNGLVIVRKRIRDRANQIINSL